MIPLYHHILFFFLFFSSLDLKSFLFSNNSVNGEWLSACLIHADENKMNNDRTVYAIPALLNTNQNSNNNNNNSSSSSSSSGIFEMFPPVLSWEMQLNTSVTIQERNVTQAYNNVVSMGAQAISCISYEKTAVIIIAMPTCIMTETSTMTAFLGVSSGERKITTQKRIAGNCEIKGFREGPPLYSLFSNLRLVSSSSAFEIAPLLTNTFNSIHNNFDNYDNYNDKMIYVAAVESDADIWIITPWDASSISLLEIIISSSASTENETNIKIMSLSLAVNISFGLRLAVITNTGNAMLLTCLKCILKAPTSAWGILNVSTNNINNDMKIPSIFVAATISTLNISEMWLLDTESNLWLANVAETAGSTNNDAILTFVSGGCGESCGLVMKDIGKISMQLDFVYPNNGYNDTNNKNMLILDLTNEMITITITDNNNNIALSGAADYYLPSCQCNLGQAIIINTESNSSIASICVSAPPGGYVMQGNMQFVECPIGTFNPNPQSTALSACQPCPPGTYSPSAGAAVCTVCPSEKPHQNAWGSDCMASCPAYYNYINKTYCTACQAGYFFSAEYAACKPCPAMSSAAYGLPCMPCEATAISVEGSTSCASLFMPLKQECVPFSSLPSLPPPQEKNNFYMSNNNNNKNKNNSITDQKQQVYTLAWISNTNGNECAACALAAASNGTLWIGCCSSNSQVLIMKPPPIEAVFWNGQDEAVDLYAELLLLQNEISVSVKNQNIYIQGLVLNSNEAYLYLLIAITSSSSQTPNTTAMMIARIHSMRRVEIFLQSDANNNANMLCMGFQNLLSSLLLSTTSSSSSSSTQPTIPNIIFNKAVDPFLASLHDDTEWLFWADATSLWGISVDLEIKKPKLLYSSSAHDSKDIDMNKTTMITCIAPYSEKGGLLLLIQIISYNTTTDNNNNNNNNNNNTNNSIFQKKYSTQLLHFVPATKEITILLLSNNDETQPQQQIRWMANYQNERGGGGIIFGFGSAIALCEISSTASTTAACFSNNNNKTTTATTIIIIAGSLDGTSQGHVDDENLKARFYATAAGFIYDHGDEGLLLLFLEPSTASIRALYSRPNCECAESFYKATPPFMDSSTTISEALNILKKRNRRRGANGMACLPCPYGQTSAVGAVGCTTCPYPGQYLGANGKDCLTCPETIWWNTDDSLLSPCRKLSSPSSLLSKNAETAMMMMTLAEAEILIVSLLSYADTTKALMAKTSIVQSTSILLIAYSIEETPPDWLMRSDAWGRLWSLAPAFNEKMPYDPAKNAVRAILGLQVTCSFSDYDATASDSSSGGCMCYYGNFMLGTKESPWNQARRKMASVSASIESNNNNKYNKYNITATSLFIFRSGMAISPFVVSPLHSSDKIFIVNDNDSGGCAIGWPTMYNCTSPGYYWVYPCNEFPAGACLPCPTGTWAPNPNDVECFALVTFQHSPSFCLAGFYLHYYTGSGSGNDDMLAATVCLPCPANTFSNAERRAVEYCDPKPTISCPQGYFLFDNGLGDADNVCIRCVECNTDEIKVPHNGACDGNTSWQPYSCLPKRYYYEGVPGYILSVSDAATTMQQLKYISCGNTPPQHAVWAIGPFPDLCYFQCKYGLNLEAISDYSLLLTFMSIVANSIITDEKIITNLFVYPPPPFQEKAQITNKQAQKNNPDILIYAANKVCASCPTYPCPNGYFRVLDREGGGGACGPPCLLKPQLCSSFSSNTNNNNNTDSLENYNTSNIISSTPVIPSGCIPICASMPPANANFILDSNSTVSSSDNSMNNCEWVCNAGFFMLNNETCMECDAEVACTVGEYFIGVELCSSLSITSGSAITSNNKDNNNNNNNNSNIREIVCIPCPLKYQPNGAANDDNASSSSSSSSSSRLNISRSEKGKCAYDCLEGYTPDPNPFAPMPCLKCPSAICPPGQHLNCDHTAITMELCSDCIQPFNTLQGTAILAPTNDSICRVHCRPGYHTVLRSNGNVVFSTLPDQTSHSINNITFFGYDPTEITCEPCTQRPLVQCLSCAPGTALDLNSNNTQQIQQTSCAPCLTTMQLGCPPGSYAPQCPGGSASQPTFCLTCPLDLLLGGTHTTTFFPTFLSSNSAVTTFRGDRTPNQWPSRFFVPPLSNLKKTSTWTPSLIPSASSTEPTTTTITTTAGYQADCITACIAGSVWVVEEQACISCALLHHTQPPLFNAPYTDYYALFNAKPAARWWPAEFDPSFLPPRKVIGSKQQQSQLLESRAGVVFFVFVFFIFY